MTAEIDERLQVELGRGERLLWSGAPGRGLRLRAADLFLIPFSLLWAGFAFFWEYSVNQSAAPFFFKLWGLPFVLVGIYIVIGRFYVDRYLRSRTCYGVTDQRVIIVTGLLAREVKSIRLQGLNDLALRETRDKSGTITFGPTNIGYVPWAGLGWHGINRRAPPSFDFLPGAREVYEIIREAQTGSDPSRAI